MDRNHAVWLVDMATGDEKAQKELMRCLIQKAPTLSNDTICEWIVTLQLPPNQQAFDCLEAHLINLLCRRELTYDEQRSASAMAQSSPKLRAKAAKVLLAMQEAGESKLLKAVTPDDVTGILNDFPGKQLIILTALGDQLQIPEQWWCSISLDECGV